MIMCCAAGARGIIDDVRLIFYRSNISAITTIRRVRDDMLGLICDSPRNEETRDFPGHIDPHFPDLFRGAAMKSRGSRVLKRWAIRAGCGAYATAHFRARYVIILRRPAGRFDAPPHAVSSRG